MCWLCTSSKTITSLLECACTAACGLPNLNVWEQLLGEVWLEPALEDESEHGMGHVSTMPRQESNGTQCMYSPLDAFFLPHVMHCCHGVLPS